VQRRLALLIANTDGRPVLDKQPDEPHARVCGDRARQPQGAEINSMATASLRWTDDADFGYPPGADQAPLVRTNELGSSWVLTGVHAPPDDRVEVDAWRRAGNIRDPTISLSMI
jgi:hypothetical protein